MNLNTDYLARLLDSGPLNDEELADVAALYNTSNSRASRCAHWLKEYARSRNEGYTIGDLSVYSQRQVFRQVPNPDHVAAFIDAMEPHERVAEIRRWIEKCRVDWMMSDLRKQDYWPSLQKELDADTDAGYLEVRGEPSLEIRSKPPNEAYAETVPPRGEPEPDAAEAQLPDAPEDFADLGDGLSSGD